MPNSETVKFGSIFFAWNINFNWIFDGLFIFFNIFFWTNPNSSSIKHFWIIFISLIPLIKRVIISESSSFKIRIMFKTNQGILLNIPFDSEISISSALQKYLIRVNRENLIKSNQEKIIFYYNASKLSINDKRRLDDIILGD